MAHRKKNRIYMEGFNATIDKEAQKKANQTYDYWTLGIIVMITVLVPVVHHAFTI